MTESVQCVTCARFSLKTSQLARHGFGHCGAKTKAEYVSISYPQQCARHQQAKEEVIAERRAWWAKASEPKPEEPPAPAAPPTIAEKVAHVKAAKQTRDHECHWPGCGKQVKPAVWGCTAHWFRLPHELRDKIWCAYRPGQETTMTPSREYLEVADEVQRWIREHGGPA